VRGVRCARREVHEERLVGHERLLLAHPVHRLVRHVLGEVVALLGRLILFHRRCAFVDGRVPLVGLTADEAVEVLETTASGRPLVERSQRTRLPHWHFVALAELRRGVAIELERHGQRRLVLGQHRGVTRRRRGDLADGAHVHRVVISAGEQRLTGGRAQRGRVKSIELQPALRQALGVRGGDRATERTRGAKPAIVDQYDEHIGRAGGWSQRLDGRERRRVWILRVVGRHAHVLRIGNWQNRALNCVPRAHAASPSAGQDFGLLRFELRFGQNALFLERAQLSELVELVVHAIRWRFRGGHR
jgi:hypothetical protein